MAGHSLYDILQSMGQDTKNLRLSATIGEVTDNRDPEDIGRVRLKFPWDWQGASTAAWAMPIYPMSGDLGMDVPEVGDFLFCLMLEGQPTDPFYIGRTRGKPRAGEVAELTTDNGSGLHLAVAEAVDEGFKQILKWMREHKHRVIVKAQGTVVTPVGPGSFTPIPTPHEVMASELPTPKLRNTKAKRVRIRRRNDPDERDVT